jgi:uncharacterized protein YjbI with pentapeptide repeats
VAGAQLEDALLSRHDLGGRDLARLRLSGCRMVNVDLSAANLAGAGFLDVSGSGLNAANAHAASITLQRVHFEGSRFTGVDLGSAVIRDCTFHDCRLNLASFRYAKLLRVSFESCELDDVDFYGTSLESVSFVDSTLARAVLAEATFRRSEMRRCTLHGAGNPERLRGLRMPLQDAVSNVVELASGLGVEIID